MSIAAYFLLSFGNQFPLMNWNTFLFFFISRGDEEHAEKEG